MSDLSEFQTVRTFKVEAGSESEAERIALAYARTVFEAEGFTIKALEVENVQQVP